LPDGFSGGTPGLFGGRFSVAVSSPVLTLSWSSTMCLLRRFSVLGLALLLLAGVSCTSSDGTSSEALGPSTEQQQSPSFGLIGDLTDGLTETTGGLTGTLVGTLGRVSDLLLCTQQPYAVATETIGPEGGVIAVGRHWLLIPRNALSRDVTIKAEQVPGKTNSVRFSPEGLQFEKPVAVSLSYENCLLVLVKKKVVYTDEGLKILEVFPSLDLFGAKRVTAPIDHFSRYAVAY
jgi:hypothetical protein